MGIAHRGLCQHRCDLRHHGCRAERGRSGPRFYESRRSRRRAPQGWGGESLSSVLGAVRFDFGVCQCQCCVYGCCYIACHDTTGISQGFGRSGRSSCVIWRADYAALNGGGRVRDGRADRSRLYGDHGRRPVARAIIFLRSVGWRQRVFSTP